jgi:hypothetical protein
MILTADEKKKREGGYKGNRIERNRKRFGCRKTLLAKSASFTIVGIRDRQPAENAETLRTSSSERLQLPLPTFGYHADLVFPFHHHDNVDFVQFQPR